jgi:hypothetical protein
MIRIVMISQRIKELSTHFRTQGAERLRSVRATFGYLITLGRLLASLTHSLA